MRHCALHLRCITQRPTHQHKQTARVRTLRCARAMTTLNDFQPIQRARPSRALAHVVPLRPRDRERRERRVLNFLVAAVGLVLAFPLMLLIAALIKLTSRGPVLFTQTRVGLDRRGPSPARGENPPPPHPGGGAVPPYKIPPQP